MSFEGHGVKVLVDPKSLPLLDGTGARLRARRPERRLQVPQPAREGPLRLRRIVPRRRRCARAVVPQARPGRGFSPLMNDRRPPQLQLLDPPTTVSPRRARLDARWRSLQAEVHPDRFAGRGRGRAAVAMQWAVRVNEAYQRLKGPARARRLPVRTRRAACRRREQHRDAAILPDATDGLARGAWTSSADIGRSRALASPPRRHRRRDLEAAAGTCSIDERGDWRPRRSSSEPDVRRALCRRNRRRRRSAGRIAPWHCCRSPNPAARPTPPAPHRGRHRPRHHATRSSPRCARRGRRVPARRAGRVILPSAVRYLIAAAAGAGSAQARPTRGARPAQTPSSR